MNDEEINKLLDADKKYSLPQVVMDREFALGLVSSNDPSFLSKIPQPYRDGVIDMGVTLEGEWLEFSSNGCVDYSEHLPALKSLVKQYLESVPLGEYINFKHAKNT
ncbi:hypothetical protein [Microbulbifer sp. JMSA002]